MAPLRKYLDYDYIIPALLRHEKYEQIALRESVRLGQSVTRNTITGVVRDIKAGKLRPSAQTADRDHYVKTYVYGQEADNGGLPVFTGHITIEGNAVVTNDWHSPYIKRPLAESVVKWAKYYGIKRMLIAGDMTNGSSQNSFKRKVKPPPFTLELDVTRQLIGYYAQYFDEIIFEPGNHDDWFLQNMDGDLTIYDFYRLLDVETLRGHFVITPYDRVTVMSGGEKWVVPHQAGYSVNPLVVGNVLAQKYQANIIVPHQHSNADGFDRWGRYRVIDSGGLFDVDMFDYINLKTNTRPNPMNGFVIIEDGAGVLITPDRRQTNWSLI